MIVQIVFKAISSNLPANFCTIATFILLTYDMVKISFIKN